MVLDHEPKTCERTHLGVKMLSQSRSRCRSSMDVTARPALERAKSMPDAR